MRCYVIVLTNHLYAWNEQESKANYSTGNSINREKAGFLPPFLCLLQPKFKIKYRSTVQTQAAPDAYEPD
jgi:hypothetical protein